MTPTAASATAVPAAVTKLIFAAFYPKNFTVDQRLGKFFPRFIINSLNRCARNVHLIGAFFLRESVQINESYSLILINGHIYCVYCVRRGVKRSETIAVWKAANFSPFPGSWHIISPHLTTEITRASSGYFCCSHKFSNCLSMTSSRFFSTSFCSWSSSFCVLEEF